MYVGLAIAYTGGALLANTWWPLVALPAVPLLVRLVVIGPEERYLTDCFGQTYLDDQSRVRRWV